MYDSDGIHCRISHRQYYCRKSSRSIRDDIASVSEIGDSVKVATEAKTGHDQVPEVWSGVGHHLTRRHCHSWTLFSKAALSGPCEAQKPNYSV